VVASPLFNPESPAGPESMASRVWLHTQTRTTTAYRSRSQTMSWNRRARTAKGRINGKCARTSCLSTGVHPILRSPAISRDLPPLRAGGQPGRGRVAPLLRAGAGRWADVRGRGRRLHPAISRDLPRLPTTPRWRPQGQRQGRTTTSSRSRTMSRGQRTRTLTLSRDLPRKTAPPATSRIVPPGNPLLEGDIPTSGTHVRTRASDDYRSLPAGHFALCGNNCPP
jgi:hypothetical protein